MDRASATKMIKSGLEPDRVRPKSEKIGIHTFPARRSNQKRQCEASTAR